MARKQSTTLTPRQRINAAKEYMQKDVPIRVIASLLDVSEPGLIYQIKPVLKAAGLTDDEIKRRVSDEGDLFTNG